MNPNVKKVLGWGAAIGVSGGVIVTILTFALNAYVGQVVDAKIKAEMESITPTTELNATLSRIEDGVGDNATAIKDVATSQQSFELIFMEYLQNEANR